MSLASLDPTSSEERICLSPEEMNNLLEELSFFDSPTNASDTGTGTAQGEHCDFDVDEPRGRKRRRVGSDTETGGTTNVFVPAPEEELVTMPSMVGENPSFRGHAMRFWSVSVGSVQRTISGLTSGLSFLSPQRRTSSQSSFSAMALLADTACPHPQHEKALDDTCSLHQQMMLNIDSARAKDFDGTNPPSLSPYFGRGPLHLALCKGASLEVVKDLLAADRTATRQRDTEGLTPLHLALKFKAPVEEAALAVLDMDPDVANMRDSFHMKPLDWALSSGLSPDSAIVKELKRHSSGTDTCEGAQRRASWHPMQTDQPLLEGLAAHSQEGAHTSCPEMAYEHASNENDGSNADDSTASLERCHEQTMWVCSRVGDYLRQLTDKGRQGTALETQDVKRLEEMSFLFGELSMRCGSFLSRDASHPDQQRPRRRKSSCDTIEAGNRTALRAHPSASLDSIASIKSAAPSIQRTVDTASSSLSTATPVVLNNADNDSIESTPTQSADKAEPHRVAFVRWHETELYACDGRSRSPQPDQPPCANKRIAAEPSGTGKIDSNRLLLSDIPLNPAVRGGNRCPLDQTQPGDTQATKSPSKPTPADNSTEPVDTGMRIALSTACSLPADSLRGRLGQCVPVKVEAHQISPSMSGADKPCAAMDAGCRQRTVASVEERKRLCANEASVRALTVANTHKRKSMLICACQAAMRAQKSTSGKMKLILNIFNDMAAPPLAPSEDGPRRFFYRIQKVFRCLQGCYSGNVDSFCKSNPSLDVSRYRCPDGIEHTLRSTPKRKKVGTGV